MRNQSLSTFGLAVVGNDLDPSARSAASPPTRPPTLGAPSTERLPRLRTIAVVDRLPAYRHGLMAGLTSYGFHVAGFPSPPFDGVEYDAVVMTLTDPADWDAFAVLRSTHPRAAAIVLLADPGIGGHRRALRLGAAGTVAHDATIEDIMAAVEAALAGNMLLPRHVVRRLLETEGQADEGVPLSDYEVSWLRALARGVTVAGVAEAARYSERQMHRLIRCLYARMGVSTRGEALVLAARWGVLD